MRVAAPTEDQIVGILTQTAKVEKNTLPPKLAARIAGESGRNLRKALLMLEAVYAHNETVTATTPIPPPDYEALIAQIADDIMAEHTPARILMVRAKMYDLLSHCIPPTTVLKGLTFRLVAKVDDELKADVIKWSAHYEHRIHLGAKHIFHLEAFVARFMRILEGYLMGIEF